MDQSAEDEIRDDDRRDLRLRPAQVVHAAAQEVSGLLIAPALLHHELLQPEARQVGSNRGGTIGGQPLQAQDDLAEALLGGQRLEWIADRSDLLALNASLRSASVSTSAAGPAIHSPSPNSSSAWRQ